MLLGLDWWVLVALALALAAGALVQSTVGLGQGLLAAPVMALLAPELMPGSMLLLVLLLPLLTLGEGWRQVDVRGLAWAMPARVPGTVLGAWLVTRWDAAALGLAIGVMVLLAVGLSGSGRGVRLGRGTLLGAGFLSGVAGTVASIGGPPLALLYQHRPLPVIRQTLAVYFLLGAALSLLALGVGGELRWHQVAVAAALTPAVLVGVLAARVSRRGLPQRLVRRVVLVVCAVSALVLIVRSLVVGLV